MNRTTECEQIKWNGWAKEWININYTNLFETGESAESGGGWGEWQWKSWIIDFHQNKFCLNQPIPHATLYTALILFFSHSSLRNVAVGIGTAEVFEKKINKNLFPVNFRENRDYARKNFASATLVLRVFLFFILFLFFSV